MVAGGAGPMVAGGGASARPTECEPGAVRCNSDFVREACGDDGTWASTDFVCARSVAVDDETGGYCVTKGDGAYLCRGGNVNAELSPARYVRVQTSAKGLIGLTETGELVSAETLIAPDLGEVATFRATNMWGYPSACPLFRDGSFGISRDRTGSVEGDVAELLPVEGSFSRAFCVYEGLMVGVRTDGTLWNERLEVAAGNDFVDVAFSLTIFCGLRTSGAITRMPPEWSCDRSTISPCVDDLPEFPGDGYRAVTATASAVCAITAQGALTCQRYNGVPMLDDPGPFTFAEGGHTVLCAIRADGSTACFRHEGDSPIVAAEVGTFTPVDPPLGPDW
jgi:hypothetical protein